VTGVQTCALPICHFYVGTNHPETGEPWSYYKTYEFCSIREFKNENVGIFIAENGGFFAKGDLNVWLFNLGSQTQKIENIGVDYYLFNGLGVGSYEVNPSSREKIASKVFKFSGGGDFYTVTINLKVNDVDFSEELKLSRFNYQTIDEVRLGCSEPQNKNEFYTLLSQQKYMANLLRKE